MIGEIAGAVGGVAGGALSLLSGGSGGTSQAKEAVRLWKKLQESNFDSRALTAPELQLVGELMPEVYTAIVPEEAQQIVESPEGRESQLTSLGQMEDIASEGLPAVDQLAEMKARESALQTGRQATDTALQSLASRGRLGGGSELSARMSAGSAAANAAAGMGAENAANAALRRMSAIGQAGQMGSNLRAADFGTANANASFTERFNELVSGLKTQEAQNNAATRNAAQASNLSTKQDIANTNTMNKYNVALGNIERGNALKSQSFGERLQKTQGTTGALQQLAALKSGQKAGLSQGLINMGSGLGGAGGGVYDLLNKKKKAEET